MEQEGWRRRALLPAVPLALKWLMYAPLSAARRLLALEYCYGSMHSAPQGGQTMQAYLVRKSADQDNPRELVGIYFADTLDQLRDLVDECIDVDCAEVREMGPGGIYWPTAVSYLVPNLADPDEPDFPEIPADASISDSWHGAFYDPDEDEWMPLAELVDD